MTEKIMNSSTQLAVEAAVFRRLIEHLDQHKEVQNIDLMIVADFCRNCLSKWYAAEASELGVNLSLTDAHQVVYKMSYDEWKKSHQTPATDEQLSAMKRRQQDK